MRRAICLIGVWMLVLGTTHLAAAQSRCETVAWPVYGEAITTERVYRATGGGLEVVERDSGERRLLTPCEGLPSSHVLAVTAYGDGAIFAVRGAGLWQWEARGGRVSPVAGGEPSLRWATAVAALGGDLVVGTVSDGVVRLIPEEGRWRVARPWPKWGKGRTTAVVVGADGALWVGRDQKGLWTLDEKGQERRAISGSVQGLRVMPDGRLLVDRGIEVCAASGKRCKATAESPAQVDLPPAGGLPSNHLTALVVHQGPDGQPALWAGTFDQGLVVRVGDRWLRPVAEGESPRFVNQLVSAGDSLWVATPTGAYRLHEGRWTRYGETAGLLTDRVNGIHVDDAGRVWFATSEGLSVWGERGISTLTTKDGLPHRIVHAVATAGGVVYAGTSDGLAIVRPGEEPGGVAHIQALKTEHGAVSANWITALLRTADGGVLSGTYDRGVDAMAGSRGISLEELGPVWVNPHGLWQDPSDGALFVSTLGDGLWRRTPGGQWARVKAPLPSDDVTSVARLDGLWIATRGGLLHVSDGR